MQFWRDSNTQPENPKNGEHKNDRFLLPSRVYPYPARWNPFDDTLYHSGSSGLPNVMDWAVTPVKKANEYGLPFSFLCSADAMFETVRNRNSN
jgi:hypothetical protein